MEAARPTGGVPSAPPPDLAIGGFSENAPWVVDLDDLPWREGIERVRARTRADVPRLVRRRRVPPAHRILRVALVLADALARWRLVDRRRGPAASRRGLSRRLRVAFQVLGPTYIKLGQILSSGEGIFPEEVVAEFKLLRDRVPPEPFRVVRQILEAELGGPLEATFASIEPEPVAAASIAQVHRARLRSGEDVVVKVQRPAVAELVRRDLAVMSWFAPFLVGRIAVAALANPPALVELFAETIVEELDFRLEADNMLAIAGVLAATGQRAIIVPRPHPRLVSRRMLVMERLEGFAFDDAAGMRAAGIDTSAVLRAGAVSFLEGAMLFGVFHGDLHGGNLFVRDDGTVAMLDFGITGRLDEPQRRAFLRLVIGATTNDVRAQMEALRDLGALPADADLDAVIRDLGLDRPPQDLTTLSADELAAQLRDLTRQLLAYGARLPKELMLFVKDLLFLDGAVATLAPDVDLLGEVAAVAAYFAERHGERIAAEVGIDPRTTPVDLEGVRASMGLGSDVEHVTYRELQARREALRRTLERQRAEGSRRD